MKTNNQNTNDELTPLQNALFTCGILLFEGRKKEHPKESYLNNTIFSFGSGLSLIPLEEECPLAANLLLKKIPYYGVKITPPDWLIHMLNVCAQGNPGYLQLMYKELLQCINIFRYHGTGIKENYLITTDDVTLCWSRKLPIILNPDIEEKYSKLWDAQKRDRENPADSDNMVDTPEYWLEVIRKG